MSLITPQNEDSPEQLSYKKDEAQVIKEDISRLKQLLKVAEKHKDSEMSEDIENQLSAQERYLKDIQLEIELLEVELGEDSQETATDNQSGDSVGLGPDEVEG